MMSCPTSKLHLVGKPLQLYFPFVAMQLPMLFGLVTQVGVGFRGILPETGGEASGGVPVSGAAVQ